MHHQRPINRVESTCEPPGNVVIRYNGSLPFSVSTQKNDTVDSARTSGRLVHSVRHAVSSRSVISLLISQRHYFCKNVGTGCICGWGQLTRDPRVDLRLRAKSMEKSLVMLSKCSQFWHCWKLGKARVLMAKCSLSLTSSFTPTWTQCLYVAT